MVRFRKLTRSLFLTLHGHNLHRQQQQLSKFLMNYQQFASHAYCGAAGPVSKMASQQGKAFCVCLYVCVWPRARPVTHGAHIEGLWLTREKLGQLPLLTVYIVPV